MNKARTMISITTVLTLFLLFSISPALAEEAGPIDLGAGSGESVVETVIEIPNPGKSVVETVVEIPDAGKSVVETIVEIPNAGEPVVETIVEIPDAGEPVVETIVEIPDAGDSVVEIAPESSVTEELQDETIPDGSEYSGSDVLNVIVPISVSIKIDPLELAGKGQVYSDIYKIENYGDTDVVLTFTDIQVTFANDTSFIASADPFVERIGSQFKAIYMLLDFGRSDIPPAVITDPNQTNDITIPLSSTQGDTAVDSLVQLNFSGAVNEFSALDWHDNDVIITMNYTLTAVPPPPAEEITPSAIEAVPPAEDITPSAIEAEPPTEEAVPPAEEAVPPAEETAPPAEETAPPAEETAPPAEETLPPAEETPPPAEETPTPPTPPESPGEPSS